MCGRFNLIATSESLIDHFELKRLPNYRPDYNIPPGQKILTVVQLDDGGRKAVYLHWGLIPSWSKDPTIGQRMINARSETLSEKPSFRTAYAKRRCLIPATGFYEWQRTESAKQAYHIHYPNMKVFAFAGLWEHWENTERTIYSCTIVTCPATAGVARIHERMPLIIEPAHYNEWLNKSDHIPAIMNFDQCSAYRSMEITPISPHVNNPIHNDSACIEAIRP